MMKTLKFYLLMFTSPMLLLMYYLTGVSGWYNVFVALFVVSAPIAIVLVMSLIYILNELDYEDFKKKGNQRFYEGITSIFKQ